jgi:hypothetical protein
VYIYLEFTRIKIKYSVKKCKKIILACMFSWDKKMGENITTIENYT